MSKWINTAPDNPEERFWPKEKGLYWAIFPGDEERDGAHVFYSYKAYMNLFEITGFDEETGVPYGEERCGGSDWDMVVAWYDHRIDEPAFPKEYNDA